MAIETHGHTISTVVTSSIMGHSGGGMFPLTLLPSYRRLRQVIREAGVYNLTKSSTGFKHVGNFIMHDPRTWKYIQRIGDDSLLNAYGLTNDGVVINARAIAMACQAGYKVIPNFYPQFFKGRTKAIEETLEAIKAYGYFLGDDFWALELNISCHNSKEKIRENINDALACIIAVKQKFPNLCLIIKISYVHPHEFAQELIGAGADVIHAINTIPYELIYKNGKPSPLTNVGGGSVSGGQARNLALLYNFALRKKLKAPIIMGCGITSLYDAKLYRHYGADAISICTVARLNSKEAEKIINELD